MKRQHFLCSLRLHCCWQLKHLLQEYEHIVKQVSTSLPHHIYSFVSLCCVISVLHRVFPACRRPVSESA